MLCFDDIKVELSCQGYKTTHLGISPDERSSVLFFESQVKTKDVHCPFCGDDVYMHETYDTHLTDVPVWPGVMHRLQFYGHRYKCKKCGKTFTEDIPFVYPGTRITERAANQIKGFLKHKVSIRAIQGMTGIHWDTIRKIQTEYMKEKIAERKTELEMSGYKPKFLAVDEFAIHKGHRYATCVMDLETGDVLWVGKGRTLSDFSKFFEEINPDTLYSKKTVKTQLGEIDVRVPRDRNGEFEPKIIGKYNRNADGMEEKILSLYACGMSQRDIAEQIKNLYDVEISPELVSKISEKIMPEVTAWQNRPLESVYPFVFMDAIHYKVKQDHQYITKAAYVVLGINLDGQKDILGIWIGEHESSKFWLNVLNDVKTRGVKDVFLFCVDALTGFREAIQAVYPNSQIQRCIIHQIRSSTRFVSYKHIKPLMSDLKKVYQAVSEDEAMNNLLIFKDKWGKTYPTCVKSWEENWDILSTFFAYPPDVRKIIYTTNIIEGLNRQFRQITKNKPSFTNDDSLRKMLYLASQKIVERWTQRCRNWDMVLNQLSIIFEDRLSA